MKTARERAAEVMAVTNDPDLPLEEVGRRIELAFKEYASDQRRVCGVMLLAAQEILVNAPFPGE